MTVIRGLQDGQGGGVLADPAVVSLSSQPLTDGFTARPARGNRTARNGKSGYGLRACGPLEQPRWEEGHNRITPAIPADRSSSLSSHIAQLHTAQSTLRGQPDQRQMSALIPGWRIIHIETN
jgi:hypothetical protein